MLCVFWNNKKLEKKRQFKKGHHQERAVTSTTNKNESHRKQCFL